MAPVSVTITVQDEAGVEVGRVTIDVPDEPAGIGYHRFDDLEPGTYTCTATLPEGYRFRATNPSRQGIASGGDNLEVSVQKLVETFIVPSARPRAKPDPEPPPWGPIAGVAAAIAAALTGSIPAPSVTGLFSQTSPPQTAQSAFVSRANRTTFKNQVDDELPRDLKERFKNCLEEGFKTVAGVTGSIESESRDTSDEELPDQLIASYTAISDVRATIEDCDPTLLLEIAAADSEDPALSPNTFPIQNTDHSVVKVTGDDVNVRAEPSLDGAVIGQVSRGEVQVGLATLNLLSPEERSLIELGEGWMPVVLASGETGFIYSAYVDAVSETLP